MENTVIWKNAVEVANIIKNENLIAKSMSVAAAAEALGYVKTASGYFVKTTITSGASSVVGATASEVAITGGVTTTACNTVLVEGVGGTAQVVGLGSVAVPIATCSLAAAGGYLVGNEIYENNQTLIDKITFPIFDFFTGQHLADELDAPTVPFMFNENFETFMPEGAMLAVQNVLNNEFAQNLTYKVTCNTSEHLFTTLNKIKLGLGITEVAECGPLQPDNSYTAVYGQRGKINVSSGSPFLILVEYESGVGKTWYAILLSREPFSAVGSYSNRAVRDSSYNYKYYQDDFRWDLTGIRTTGGLEVFYFNAMGPGSPNSNMPPWIMKQPVSTAPPQPYNYTPNPTNWQKNNILNATSVLTSGPPVGVTKYTPGTSPQPLTVPNKPAWVPVILPPAPNPGEKPKPKPIPFAPPDTPTAPDAEPKPEKISPYINPKQPQPDKIPVIKPSTIPATPPLTLPDPTPNPSNAPYPKSDPSTDPSQSPGTNTNSPTLPEIPPLPEPVNSGSTPKPPIPGGGGFMSSADGLLHVYNPTEVEINQFGKWLWTTFSGDIIDTVSKLFNNPMDAVIGLHEIYCTPSTGDKSPIKAGYLSSGIASRLVKDRYVEIDCGALSVPEYWNNYLDYSPYTKVHCYLPFIGIVELNADDIIGHGVQIIYRVDTYNGSCIAMIMTAKSGSSECVTFEFSGNCAVEIPITSGMKSAMQSALIGAAVTAVTVGSGGTAAAGAKVLAGGFSSGASSKNSVQHSGSFGSSYGAMGIKHPYIIVKRPKQKVVAGYNENYGYPSHKMVRIGDCSGYLRAREVNVISSTATEEEKHMIEKMLKEGIYVR